jgi:2-amino-4-hydroxy-6-hydroxymethyldihydropteridine diphosphokinase
MMEVLIGMGSNLGDRERELCLAIDFLQTLSVKLVERSAVYESEPFEFQSMNQFLNMCVSIEVESLTPMQLLASLKAYEKGRGRLGERVGEYSDRPIDLDILFFSGLVWKDAALEIPHPEIENREFVMVPLKELAPDFTHPLRLVSLEKCYSTVSTHSVKNKGVLKCI